MPKLRVGVIFGGRSGEHEVSLISARAILAGLDRAKYEIVPIAITKQGGWLVGPAGSAQLLPGDVLNAGTELVLPPQPQSLVRSGGTAPHLDVIFPVLHGTFGEDGTIQGLLELAGIPYVGSGVLGSAAAMDKDVMKRLFAQARLPIVPHVVVRRSEWELARESVSRRLVRELGYPMFVKPANLGSSVGISKVHSRPELAPAMDLASRYDQKIVIEHGIDAREIECSVLGNEKPIASTPGEIIPSREFYDYEAKYIDEGSRALIPAALKPAVVRRVRELSIRAFQATDCSGLARVDFLLDRKTSKLFVNEINSMPGFTPISMFPKLWAASGISFSELIDRLIDLALERDRDRKRSRYSLVETA